MLFGQPMKLTTHLIFTVPAFLAPSFSVVMFAWTRSATTARFFRSLAAAFGNLGCVFQVHQRVKRRLNHVVRVRRAEGLLSTF